MEGREGPVMRRRHYREPRENADPRAPSNSNAHRNTRTHTSYTAWVHTAAAKPRVA